MFNVSYESLERYRTARHEAIHALAAVRFGHRVVHVDIANGQATIEWSCFSHEIPRIVQRDPERAALIVKGVIAVCAAPSLDEREPVSGDDKAVLDEWKEWWTSSARHWNTIYCDAACETRQWLRERPARLKIEQLAQTLFVHGTIEGRRLQRIMAKIATAAPAPTPPARTPQPKSDYSFASKYITVYRPNPRSGYYAS